MKQMLYFQEDGDMTKGTSQTRQVQGQDKT